MKSLREIWEEIRHGENIDVYLSIVFAVGFSAVAIIGDLGVGTEKLLGLLLIILALLAASNLRNLHATKRLSEQLSNSAKTSFLKEFPSSLQDDFESASELWIVGVSLAQTIRNNYSEMELKLRKGHAIRILLVHPDGAASEIAASRPYPPAEVAQIRRQIQDSLNYLWRLKAIKPENLEIRTIQNPLTRGFIAINPDSTSGVLYIEEYPYQTMGNVLPRFVLRAKEEYWYAFFKSELHNLWNSGIDWKS